MKVKLLFTIIVVAFTAFMAKAQISAKLMRDVDISNSQITFVYGGDIWIAPKEGGQAFQLTNSL